MREGEEVRGARKKRHWQGLGWWGEVGAAPCPPPQPPALEAAFSSFLRFLCLGPPGYPPPPSPLPLMRPLLCCQGPCSWPRPWAAPILSPVLLGPQVRSYLGWGGQTESARGPGSGYTVGPLKELLSEHVQQGQEDWGQSTGVISWVCSFHFSLGCVLCNMKMTKFLL